MASAEGGSVPSEVRYGERCPLLSRLWDLRQRRELPSGGFWILAYFEGHRTLLFVPDKI